MYNYISFIICCIILIYLLHYIYEKIKDSIIYCINYNPYNNYETIFIEHNTSDTNDNNIDNYIEKDLKDNS